MKKPIIVFLLFSFILQTGCGSFTQIPYPTDERKSGNEIRQLNYFGERLSSKIELTNSVEIEAYRLLLKDDKLYFLSEGLDDTTSINVDKVKTVRFYDMYGGCMKGGLLALGLFVFSLIAFGSSGNQKSTNEYAALTAIFALVGSIGVGIISGMLFFGEREFNFVQNK